MYFKKRVFRLFPELLFGVIVNCVVMLFLYRDSIECLPFLVFQFTQATFLQFWTPDCLRAYGCGTPNGALWTIGVMLQSYIVFYFLFKILKNRSNVFRLIILFITAIINIVTPFIKVFLLEVMYKLFSQTFLPYIWLFVLGGIICANYERLVMIFKRLWPLFLFLTLLTSFSHLEEGYGLYETIKSSFLTFTIIGFGYSFPKLKIKHDISYGIYICHMVVINAFIQLGFIGEMMYVWSS